MSSGIGDAFNREILGSATAAAANSELPEGFKRETLGVTHPGHEAVMALDPDYFAALKNYYSTWTISRKDAAISRPVMEFIITGILLTQGKMQGARVHVRRALLAGATPRELFQAVRGRGHPGRGAGHLARRGDGQSRDGRARTEGRRALQRAAKRRMQRIERWQSQPMVAC